MANTLRFKRGLASGLPTGVAGEPLFTTDTFDLYIGTGAANQRYQKYIASGTTLQYLRGDGSLATFPTNIITGTGVAGQVAYWSGASTQTGSNNLFWDNTNARLGIGTNTPAVALDIRNGANLYTSGASANSHYLELISTTSTDAYVNFRRVGLQNGPVAYHLQNGLARFSYDGATGDTILGAYSNAPLLFFTNSTQRARITAGGNFIINNASTDNGLRLQVTGDGYFSGSVGIGTTGLSNTNLNITKNLTGSTNTYGIYNSGSIRSDVLTGASMFTSNPSIQNAVFTLSALRHFQVDGISSVGSATIATQFGFMVESTMTGATTNYGFYGNIAAATGRWNIFMDGTANNFMRGSLLVGTSTTPTGEALQVTGTMKVTGASTMNGINSASRYIVTVASSAGISDISYGSLSGGVWVNTPSSTNGYLTVAGNASFKWNSTELNFYISAAEAMRLDANGLGIGITPSTFKLDVNGTMRASGAATFSSSVTAASLVISGTSTSAYIGSITQTNTTAGVSFGLLVKGGTNSSDVALNVQSAASANLFRVFGDGQAIFSSSIQAATAIAIGTTPDTNKPFKILKNINATVGINFENTSTSSLAFSAIQMGTDVTGGTKFTNLVYASSGVVANGVYNPDGTSLINNGGGGLNFLGTPIRFYTGGSNGVLRLLFDNEGTTQFTATTPTTNVVDGYRQYSADVVAGNAAPHFRTENGGIIKLYQETTGVGNAIFSQGGGTGVLDDSTFDGYTLRQIVKALRNQGILA